MRRIGCMCAWERRLVPTRNSHFMSNVSPRLSLGCRPCWGCDALFRWTCSEIVFRWLRVNCRLGQTVALMAFWILTGLHQRMHPVQWIDRFRFAAQFGGQHIFGHKIVQHWQIGAMQNETFARFFAQKWTNECQGRFDIPRLPQKMHFFHCGRETVLRDRTQFHVGSWTLDLWMKQQSTHL